jgi:hypothetical protein
VIDELNKQK